MDGWLDEWIDGWEIKWMIGWRCYQTKFGSTCRKHSKTNVLILGCNEGKCSSYCKVPSREYRQFVLKDGTTLRAFGKGFLKVRWRRGMRVSDHLMCIPLTDWWWGHHVVFQESTWSTWFQPSWGPRAGDQHAVNFFYLVWVLVATK